MGTKEQVSIGSSDDDFSQGSSFEEESASWASDGKSWSQDQQSSMSCGSQQIDWRKVFLMKRTLTVFRQHAKDIKEMPKMYYYNKSFDGLKQSVK